MLLFASHYDIMMNVCTCVCVSCIGSLLSSFSFCCLAEHSFHVYYFDFEWLVSVFFCRCLFEATHLSHTYQWIDTRDRRMCHTTAGVQQVEVVGVFFCLSLSLCVYSYIKRICIELWLSVQCTHIGGYHVMPNHAFVWRTNGEKNECIRLHSNNDNIQSLCMKSHTGTKELSDKVTRIHVRLCVMHKTMLAYRW